MRFSGSSWDENLFTFAIVLNGKNSFDYAVDVALEIEVGAQNDPTCF